MRGSLGSGSDTGRLRSGSAERRVYVSKLLRGSIRASEFEPQTPTRVKVAPTKNRRCLRDGRAFSTINNWTL